MLSPYFGGMIAFVKDTEITLERETRRDRIMVDERESFLCTSGSHFPILISFTGRIQQLVRGFNTDWKKSIESINTEIMKSFTNFKNGTAILQVSST